MKRTAIRTEQPGPARPGKAGIGRMLVLALSLLTGTLGPGAAAQTVGSSLDSSLRDALGSSLNDGFAVEEFLPVEEAYPLAVERSGPGELRLIWQMPAGYYLYQHAFRFSLEFAGQSTELVPQYPPALTREDEYFGRVEVYYNSAEITLRSDTTLDAGSLSVTSQGCADAGLCYPPRTQYFELRPDGTLSETAAPTTRAMSDGAARQVPGAPSSAGTSAFLLMLLLAFAGGAILNLMPCVLPILSLKVLGFAMATPNERHRHGLLYTAGVICSFLVVAGTLLLLRSSGQAIGWGFQLQSPGFVIALAYLFVVLGLALSGVVELGNQFMNLGSGLASRDGASGSFYTGVLAVVVASPCTAPFMGTALGYALVQPPLTGLLVFAALGMGMAAPMLLLSYSELARRLMPRPGQWMERLKQALAFPLYATALWLFWVAGRQGGVDLMAAALLGALLLALGLWLWKGAWVARSTALACILGAIALATWRPLEPQNPGSTAMPAGSVAFSAERLESLRRDGKSVFVDVTADWCITCLANERAVLGTKDVQAAFRSAGVTYMVADWTDYDAAIADFVASHGRSGIPLYVIYHGELPPKLLPQLLRKQTVIGALEQLSGVASGSSGAN